jgi:hypothetical protein
MRNAWPVCTTCYSASALSPAAGSSTTWTNQPVARHAAGIAAGGKARELARARAAQYLARNRQPQGFVWSRATQYLDVRGPGHAMSEAVAARQAAALKVQQPPPPLSRRKPWTFTPRQQCLADRSLGFGPPLSPD